MNETISNLMRENGVKPALVREMLYIVALFFVYSKASRDVVMQKEGFELICEKDREIEKKKKKNRSE